MDNSSIHENRLFVYRLCYMWGCAIGSWAVLQVTVPLIIIDIVGKKTAPMWQGIFFATTAISGMSFCGIIGYYSDYIGRKKFIFLWLLCFFVLNICVILGDITQSIYFLWISRFAAISIPHMIIHALLSDYLIGNLLLESFSYISATFGISVLFSSIICGLIGKYYSRFISLIFGLCLSGISIIICLVYIKIPTQSLHCLKEVKRTYAEEKEKKEEDNNNNNKEKNIKNCLYLIYKDILLRNFIFALSILRICNVNINMMLILFVNFRLGWEQMELSIMMGISGFLSILHQLIGVKFIISSQIVLPIFFIILGISPLLIIGYAVVMTGIQLYIVSILISIITILTTILNAKITQLSSEYGISGLVLGTVGTIQNFLEIITSLLFGKLMAWSFTTFSHVDIMSGFPFIINGILLMLAVGIIFYSHVYYGEGRIVWD